MKATPLLALAALLLCPVIHAEPAAKEVQTEAAQAKAAEQKWISLFNGKDLTGWKNAYTWGEAEVVEGEIRLTSSNKFFLTTEETYGDFELEVEIMLPEVGPANSGVMYRCHVEKGKVFGYQAECDPSERAWTGRLYDEGRRAWALLTDDQKAKTKSVRAPLGKWIKYRILAVGDHLQVWVDGELTTDLHDKMDAKGHIGLQHHGEKGKTYRFRNVRIRPADKSVEIKAPEVAPAPNAPAKK